MPEPSVRILHIEQKKLVGHRLTMSFTNNRTPELWRNFMSLRKNIKNSLNTNLFSLQVFPECFDFDPQTEFEKWAAVEVADFTNVPETMESFVVQAGLYAVFDYKGLSTDTAIFHYIFGTWLPQSDYSLDHRPHFEILGEKYKNNDPDSEEEIGIPIRPKGAGN